MIVGCFHLVSAKVGFKYWTFGSVLAVLAGDAFRGFGPPLRATIIWLFFSHCWGAVTSSPCILPVPALVTSRVYLGHVSPRLSTLFSENYETVFRYPLTLSVAFVDTLPCSGESVALSKNFRSSSDMPFGLVASHPTECGVIWILSLTLSSVCGSGIWGSLGSQSPASWTSW